jgi:DNA modification methylase
MRFSPDRIEHWPITRLIPYARNARTHSDAQVAQIAASISEFGFNNPVLVDGADGIIAGHGRVLGARKLGLEQVPVIVLPHLSENEKRAYILADNRLAEAAGWDEEMLRLELEALADQNVDFSVTGFDEDQLAKLQEAHAGREGLTDEDAVPEQAREAISAPGDLWLLSDHRVYCGDVTRSEDLDRLMAGERADLVFTDPPYNVDYEGHTEQRMTIQGDRMSREEFERFLNAAFSSYKNVVAPHASVYVCHSSSWQREFQQAIEASGFAVRCQLIWAKNTFAWGFGRYKFQHEPIFYCHVAGEKDLWFGDKSQSTLWEEKKPAANRLHPTTKPVELVERALMNSSKSGAIVADLFGGSGSTLIACERRSRRARLMEIDPTYCDVIVRRWQEYTGRAAVLAGCDRSFGEIAAERRSKPAAA